MTDLTTDLKVGRPLVKLADDRYAEWCSYCNSPPSPPDGSGDVLLEIYNLSRGRRLELSHVPCVKARRKDGR